MNSWKRWLFVSTATLLLLACVANPDKGGPAEQALTHVPTNPTVSQPATKPTPSAELENHLSGPRLECHLSEATGYNCLPKAGWKIQPTFQGDQLTINLPRGKYMVVLVGCTLSVGNLRILFSSGLTDVAVSAGTLPAGTYRVQCLHSGTVGLRDVDETDRRIDNFRRSS